MLFCILSSSFAQSGDVNREWIRLISPKEGSGVIAKKPYIKCEIKVKFSPENLLVALDGMDVTGIIKILPEGFELEPVEVLSAGIHTLSIMLYSREGEQLQREFTFYTRHSKIFEEAYSENEISTVYETVIDKPHDIDTVPYSKVESNLRSTTILKEKSWELSFTTNMRFLDQSLPVYYPQKKGLNPVNYLFKGEYSSEDYRFFSEIGDIQVNETQNTIQMLARRGGRVFLNFKNLTLDTFVVRSDQVFGFRGGFGIEGTSDDHIFGASAGIGLLSNRIHLKTIYIKGGEKESSYFGTWGVNGGKKGEVLGVVVKADLLKQKLTAEAEVDFSEFDADTSDEFPYDSDKAYKLRVGGYIGNYSYEVLYEYMGPEYEVIGNQGLPKDREGITIRTGASFQGHSFNLSLSRYNDNVEGEELYPRIYTYQGTVDYTFSKIQNLSLGINYQKSIVDSSNEPEYTSPLRIDTDTVSGRINYMKGPLNLGLQISHSIQNDRTTDDNDTTTTTYTLTPTYFSEHLSVSPNLSFNRTKYKLTGVRTDTFTLTLDMRGELFTKKITYEFGGTYNDIRSSDGTVKQKSYNANFRIAYSLGRSFLGFMNPSVGVRGVYNKMEDKVYNEENEDLILLLVLSTSIPFSL